MFGNRHTIEIGLDKCCRHATFIEAGLGDVNGSRNIDAKVADPVERGLEQRQCRHCCAATGIQHDWPVGRVEQPRRLRDVSDRSSNHCRK